MVLFDGSFEFGIGGYFDVFVGWDFDFGVGLWVVVCVSSGVDLFEGDLVWDGDFVVFGNSVGDCGE